MALPAATASAEGIPDLMGTWAILGEAFAAARVGSGSPAFEPLPEPTFGKPEQAFTFRIDRQEGRAFYGTALSGGDYQGDDCRRHPLRRYEPADVGRERNDRGALRRRQAGTPLGLPSCRNGTPCPLQRWLEKKK